MKQIEFNRPYRAANEKKYLNCLLERGSGSEGKNIKEHCSSLAQQITGSRNIRFTSSGTASLEVAGIVSRIGFQDEVIVPSFTFSSTANAFAIRGARPVFVDVKEGTLNLDETKVERAITERTKAIVVVHYAGIAANLIALREIADRYGLALIEDAAQCIGSSYFGRPLGTWGDMGAISFHQTKNIQCGEGGLLISARTSDHESAGTVIEKGTNREDMILGKVNKYQWVSLGSSYVLSNLQKAVLAAQLESVEEITSKRKALWFAYLEAFSCMESLGLFELPQIEVGADLNGHIFYVILRSGISREAVMDALAAKGIEVTSHYEPLHLSPAGKEYGRLGGKLEVTERISPQLLRFPLWPEMELKDIDRIADATKRVLSKFALSRRYGCDQLAPESRIAYGS